MTVSIIDARKFTKSQIVEELDKLGIEFDENAHRLSLAALLNKAVKDYGVEKFEDSKDLHQSTEQVVQKEDVEREGYEYRLVSSSELKKLEREGFLVGYKQRGNQHIAILHKGVIQ